MDEGLIQELAAAEIAAQLSIGDELLDGLVRITMGEDPQSMDRAQRIAVMMRATLHLASNSQSLVLLALAIDRLAHAELSEAGRS